MDEIKFYGIKEETISIPRQVLDDAINKDNEHFNKALKSVVEKDINKIDDAILKMEIDITKKLALAGVILEEKLYYKAQDIDKFIDFVQDKMSNLIIEKGSIKIRLFTRKKKEKKKRIALLQEEIEYIEKCQNELIMLKKEYEKLTRKDLKIDNTIFSSEVSKELRKEDPLERTINFYMKQQERGH